MPEGRNSMVDVIKQGAPKDYGDADYERNRIKKELRYEKRKRDLADLEVAGVKDAFLGRRGNHPDRLERIAIRKVMGGKFVGSMNAATYARTVKEYFSSVAKMPKVSVEGEKVVVSRQNPCTIEGLCNFVGICVKTFNRMCQSEEAGEFREISLMARQMVSQKVLEGGLMGDFNSRLAKFYLENITDMKDGGEEREQSRAAQNITFITVNSRDEAKALKEEFAGAIDVTAEDMDEEEDAK